MLDPKPDNWNTTTPLAVSIPTSNDNLVNFLPAPMSALRQNSRGACDQVSIVQNSHQIAKENSVVPQRITLASVNHDSTGDNIIPATVNAKASSAQPTPLSSSSTAPQIQVQRPLTSHQASKENIIVPQRTILSSPNNKSIGNNVIPTTLNAKASSAQPTPLTSSFAAPHIQIQRQPTSHQASKENSIVLQQATLASVGNDSIGNNIISTSLNGKASSTQSKLPSNLTIPQIQIQRPPTSHQVFKENSIISQHATLPSVGNDTIGNNIILASSNGKAPSTQSKLPSNLITPQIQIQRPPTSLSTRNNPVTSTLPSAVIVPQIHIHHLITTTAGTGKKSESPHSDFRIDTSMPRTPGAGADLEISGIKRLASVNADVLPIQVDQPQDFLGSGNKLYRPVPHVPTSMADANDVRTSINERTMPSHAEDSRFNILRGGCSQEVTTQTVVNNYSVTLTSHQPDPASSTNQRRHDSVQNIIPQMQMNNGLAQGSPSLGFFNNAFSEVLHSPVVRRSDHGDHPAMKSDGKVVAAVFETDNATNQTSLVNRDAARNVLSREQSEGPSVEQLITQNESHTDIHNSKVAFSQIPSEVNRSSKFPSSTSQPRIQHPGLAAILSSPFPKNDNVQPSSSSTAHHQPTYSSTVSSKTGLSPKFQGSLDKQRPDDKLLLPTSSPSRQPPSDFHHKELEQHLHESPKGQPQQTPIATSRSAHLQRLLSDPHSLGLTPSNIPSSSSHPSIGLCPPRITYTVPDGITSPFLESLPQVNNKKPGLSDPSYPEVPISTGGPSQVEELTSQKIRPTSTLDSKPLGDNMPHYRTTTPLREPPSTTRHQHSMSLPVHLVPSANVPSADGSLRSAAHPSLHHHSTSQTKPQLLDSQTLAPNTTHAVSDSEETILMTPSSLARSVMLKPTVSRQSVTPSMSSQTIRKKTGLFTMFRSKTPAHPPPQYEIWHPNTSSKTADPNVAHSGTVPSSFAFPDQRKTSASTPVPVVIERPNQKSKIFTPFRYLTTKRNRAVSLVSVEAQDGTAPSTIVGSPTASMLSQAPFQPPPVRDPMKATEEWRDREGETHPNGKLRRQRPGVVFDVAEELPEDSRRQRPKRTRTRHKSSSKPS